MKRLLNLILRPVLVLSGFLFIFSLPALLGIGKQSIQFHFGRFWLSIETLFMEIIHFQHSKYRDFLSQLEVGESYRYTMTILVICLLIILVFSIVFSTLVILSPEKISNKIKKLIHFFEAVPDLLIIFLFQILVITLYKTYGLKIFQLYDSFGVKPYFIPVVTISFLPLFLLTQFVIKILEEEQTQLYALFGTAKGLGQFRILVVHILRNVFPLLILQLRNSTWLILSNIYLVEYMFNIGGFTRVFQKVLFMDGDFVSLVICLIMFTVPLILIEAIGFLTSRLLTGKERLGL
ncbi:ABC transporter permease subunit [Bacillus xiapuensis]|uniref:ABC transporter permease subunit n=1 Tax=Bacillus xiapuensis TaxID=2014075 RepID=A0ABU6NAC3_9BACI|nr:ABC transporter permease subunit [Bacillus xiapuensis]